MPLIDGGITSAAVGVWERLIPLFGAHNMPVTFDNDWLLCHSSLTNHGTSTIFVHCRVVFPPKFDVD